MLIKKQTLEIIIFILSKIKLSFNLREKKNKILLKNKRIIFMLCLKIAVKVSTQFKNNLN